jgi:hypothetical protein
MTRYTLILFALLIAVVPLRAQDADEPEELFFVLNQAQISMTDMPKAWDIWKQATTVLQELKDEGLLVEFGLLQHAWGDEWNWNFYMITKDHASFLKAWDEYITRVREKYPDLVRDWLAMVKAHKDNMYSLFR